MLYIATTKQPKTFSLHGSFTLVDRDGITLHLRGTENVKKLMKHCLAGGEVYTDEATKSDHHYCVEFIDSVLDQPVVIYLKRACAKFVPSY